MKKCNRCQQDLPLSAFNRNRTALDGLQGSCRPCQIESNREWRERNREHAKIQQARYAERHAVAVAERKKDWKRRNRLKVRAHKAVARAIASGVVIRPSMCEDCGSEAFVHAHHEDYARVLEVTWCCPTCHQRRHAGLVDK